MNIEIIPTVVPNTFDDIEVFVARSSSFAKALHIDAVDGIFAPNKTWMPGADRSLPDHETIFYEAHLMIARPEATGKAFIAAGAKRIITHISAFEAEDDMKRTFDVWKQSGAKEVCLALVIETPLEALEPFVFMCDGVTLMSIATIGQQGIPFDERSYGRVADLHARYPDLVIEVDGGVGAQQIPALVRAGARRFSVGSAIAKSEDPAATHRQLLEIAQAAL